jgi:hypothetical protein
MTRYLVDDTLDHSDYCSHSHSWSPCKSSFAHFSLPRQTATVLESRQVQDLLSLGFPLGLALAMNENKVKFPLRVWVIDNSRSMEKPDGSHVHAKSKGTYKVTPCSRWKEMRETVVFHAEMAAKIQSPTMFRLLNKPFSSRLPREFAVARDGLHCIQRDLELARETMRKVDPRGGTPLTKRIHEIRENVLALKGELEENDERIVLVLATDGIPTNLDGESPQEVREEFVKALKSLQALPVWTVVRLCTNAEDVVEFYHSLDCVNGMSLEVLDDYFAEAKKVYRYNKWINYALPIHRAREMGFYHPLFDVLNERKLALVEVKEYFRLIFGEDAADLMPDPCQDFRGFLLHSKELLASKPHPYNPITRKTMPWVDVRKLAWAYRSLPCCVM